MSTRTSTLGRLPADCGHKVQRSEAGPCGLTPQHTGQLSVVSRQWSVVLSSLLYVCATRSPYRCCCWSLLYSAVLRSRADSLRSICDPTRVNIFYSAFLNISRSGVLTALTWLVPHDTAAVSTRSVYTIQPCTMSLYAKPRT